MDVCMWAKNGANYLPTVLKQIDKVIPKEFVGQKIFVDDQSTDNSVDLAKKFGWTVYHNTQGGVCGGFNEAVKHVRTKFFVSVEQDVVLAPEWFNIVSRIVDNPKVAVAQGIRVPSEPVLRAIYLDKIENEAYESQLISLDNNVWRTSVIKEIGGFPEDLKFAADRYLYPRILQRGYQWVTDHSIVSIHIREGIRKNYAHDHQAILRADIPQQIDTLTAGSGVNLILNGLRRSVRVAFKKNLPIILVAYPYMCLMNLRTKIRLKGIQRKTVL
ncbi:MAG: glycosyltransferase family A protein [Candidatus Bathyarchaeia archaeon]|jgi:glycosyltransferase involved in cell wall biosynthesis